LVQISYVDDLCNLSCFNFSDPLQALEILVD